MEFENKVALITGAAVGIGRTVALKMAERGASLVLLDVNAEKLEKVKEELSLPASRLLTLPCDVSNEVSVNQAVEAALAHFGRIDILINNAAIWRSWNEFWLIPTEEWKKFIDVNLMSVVYCTRAVLGGMLQNGYGRIVNVASVAGVYGNARMSCYSATKAAVISLSAALAKEVADKGITVNCVSPGTVTPSDHTDIHYTEPNELSHMGRTGSDSENAELICFLSSDRSPYLSGQNIQIDGCRKKI